MNPQEFRPGVSEAARHEYYTALEELTTSRGWKILTAYMAHQRAQLIATITLGQARLDPHALLRHAGELAMLTDLENFPDANLAAWRTQKKEK